MLELPEALERQLREDGKRGEYKSLYRRTFNRQKGRSKKCSFDRGRAASKINLGIEEEEWNRFHALVALRKSEQINEKAQQELTALTEKIEAAHAARLPYLVELAFMRNVTLSQLMKDLGLDEPLFVYD